MAVPPGSMGSFAPVLTKWFGSNGGYGLFFDSTGATLGFNTANGTSQDNVNSPAITFTPGQWYFVAGTWSPNPGEKALYVDGVKRASGTASNAAINVQPATLEIGHLSTWFHGKIDEVRVSDVVRSSDWIRTEFNNVADPTSVVFGTEQPDP